MNPQHPEAALEKACARIARLQFRMDVDQWTKSRVSALHVARRNLLGMERWNAALPCTAMPHNGYQTLLRYTRNAQEPGKSLCKALGYLRLNAYAPYGLRKLFHPAGVSIWIEGIPRFTLYRFLWLWTMLPQGRCLPWLYLMDSAYETDAIPLDDDCGGWAEYPAGTPLYLIEPNRIWSDTECTLL